MPPLLTPSHPLLVCSVLTPPLCFLTVSSHHLQQFLLLPQGTSTLVISWFKMSLPPLPTPLLSHVHFTSSHILQLTFPNPFPPSPYALQGSISWPFSYLFSSALGFIYPKNYCPNSLCLGSPRFSPLLLSVSVPVATTLKTFWVSQAPKLLDPHPQS